MPSFSIDATTARQLLELAERRNCTPEDVLVDLVHAAAAEQRQSAADDKRGYWIQHEHEERRRDWES